MCINNVHILVCLKLHFCDQTLLKQILKNLFMTCLLDGAVTMWSTVLMVKSFSRKVPIIWPNYKGWKRVFLSHTLPYLQKSSRWANWEVVNFKCHWEIWGFFKLTAEMWGPKHYLITEQWAEIFLVAEKIPKTFLITVGTNKKSDLAS